MNHILWGVNPGCGLPSNQDPKGTNATSLICVSRHLSLSNTLYIPRITFPGLIDSVRLLRCNCGGQYWVIKLCKKMFPSNNFILIRSYGSVWLIFSFHSQSATLCLAEDGHCRNTITGKWDLTALTGSSDTMDDSLQSWPHVSTYCHMLCEWRGVCPPVWDLIVVSPKRIRKLLEWTKSDSQKYTLKFKLFCVSILCFRIY